MSAYSFRRFPVLLSMLVVLASMMSSAPAAAQQEPPATDRATPLAGLPGADQGQARAWASSIAPVQPPFGDSSGALPAALPQASRPAGTTYSYQLLKETLALRADGRGDVVLESRLEVGDWPNEVWCFPWPEDAYSAISAMDDQGSLDVFTNFDGKYFCVDVKFRQPIQPGDSYHYYLAITIKDLASHSGSIWRTTWGSQAPAAIELFILGVTLPANAFIQSVSLSPTTQSLNYVEWRYEHLPPAWGIQVTIDYYILPNKVHIPLIMR